MGNAAVTENGEHRRLNGVAYAVRAEELKR
jgi:hypothetical protein